MKNPGHWTKALVLIGLAFLIYGFGIGREFVSDDVIYISGNALLRRDDGFSAYWFSSDAFNYYPLFWSLLRIQWLLWGDHPLGYHLVNLLLHGVNAILLWRICLTWKLPGAWWAAALFAVHPINVQTVAWAAEQKNTWSFLFMALALIAFLRHVRDRHWTSYALSGAGRLDEADRAFLEARALLKEDPDSYVNRGAVLLRLGREDDAAAEFRSALDLDGDKPSAHLNLLTIGMRRGQVDEAGAHLEAAGVASAAYGRRIAEAITRTWRERSAPKETLLRFAGRACVLSGNQPELMAAFTDISKDRAELAPRAVSDR